MQQEQASAVAVRMQDPPARAITVRPRNQSPKASSVQNPNLSSSVMEKHVHESITPPARENRDNAGSKQSCEVRVTCCQKVMKCSGLTLAVVLVATTAAIAYYLYGLQGTCSQLIGPVNGINDSLKQALPLAQGAIRLANETLTFIKEAEPKFENLYNMTATMCLNAQHVCNNAEASCKNPFGG